MLANIPEASKATTPKKIRRPPPICIYCGKSASTRDHVPPQAIFVELRRPDLITVPSCETCNNEASRFDEGFRNIIGMRASEGSPNSSVLLQKTLRSLKRKPRDRQAIWESLREVPIFTKGCLYIGHSTEAAFDAEAHDRTVERITRALYFHHFKKSLPGGSNIEVMFISDGANWQQSIAPFLAHMKMRNIGGPKVFEYAFAHATDEPDGSLWIYRFYERHLVATVRGSLADQVLGHSSPTSASATES